MCRGGRDRYICSSHFEHLAHGTERNDGLYNAGEVGPQPPPLPLAAVALRGDLLTFPRSH